jgi:hypothetical protein
MCRTVYPLSMTIILDIIHRLSVSEHNVSETGSVSFFRYKSGGRENIYVFIFINVSILIYRWWHLALTKYILWLDLPFSIDQE